MRLILSTILVLSIVLIVSGRPQEANYPSDSQGNSDGASDTDVPTIISHLNNGWNWFKTNVPKVGHAVGRAFGHGWKSLKESDFGKSIQRGFDSSHQKRMTKEYPENSDRRRQAGNIDSRRFDYPDFIN